jgi:addiction module HigA family antidote
MSKTFPLRDPRRCPSHPGAVLRDIVLPALAANKTAIAEALGISRTHLYEILNERQPVMPGTAVRLEAAIGGSARSWLNMQGAYDLWHAQRRVDVSRVPSLGRAMKTRRRRSKKTTPSALVA